MKTVRDMDQLFTISAFTQNRSGVLHRLTSTFTKRKINIESLCVSETETTGISRFTISVRATEETIKKIVAQISKIIEVVKVDYHTDDDLFFREIALFKVAYSGSDERLEIKSRVAKYNAVVAIVTDEFLVVEKTGREADVTSLYHVLEAFEILEFVRSGRIAVPRTKQQVISRGMRQIVRSDQPPV